MIQIHINTPFLAGSSHVTTLNLVQSRCLRITTGLHHIVQHSDLYGINYKPYGRLLLGHVPAWNIGAQQLQSCGLLQMRAQPYCSHVVCHKTQSDTSA